MNTLPKLSELDSTANIPACKTAKERERLLTLRYIDRPLTPEQQARFERLTIRQLREMRHDIAVYGGKSPATPATPDPQALDPHTLGTPTPLLASSPVARILRGPDSGQNRLFRVVYSDNQHLDIYARPESTDERILALATQAS